METIARAKKWGNSIGVIIPNEIVEQQNISSDDELILTVEKKNDRERTRLMKEGYTEMANESKKINKEWEKADVKWPS
ncbi:MAG: AbrB/MazE/SpoVT family DNA-binding domain-containing protein [Candidatus Aenigmatarchaeota archaeon]